MPDASIIPMILVLSCCEKAHDNKECGCQNSKPTKTLAYSLITGGDMVKNIFFWGGGGSDKTQGLKGLKVHNSKKKIKLFLFSQELLAVSRSTTS